MSGRALYEVTNGYIGESYTRCYAWADSELAARRMAGERFRADSDKLGASHRYPSEYWETLTVRKLFDADAAPFSTLVSTEGWRIPDEEGR